MYVEQPRELVRRVHLASVLPRYTFVAKAELRKHPAVRLAARERPASCSIERENRKAAFESYEGAAQQVAAGGSIVVFPEGTRGHDYSLRPFKKGPFVLAIAARRRSFPCVVYGTLEVHAEGQLRASGPAPCTCTSSRRWRPRGSTTSDRARADADGAGDRMADGAARASTA